MKLSLFTLLILCTLSCAVEQEACIDIPFGTPTEVQTNDLVCIEGAEYTFLASDQRCPCGQTCIWEGEFILNFEDADGINVYTYHQVDTAVNLVPPFSESLILTNFFGQVEGCGDDSKIDEVTFVIQLD